jgi:hypothetical protein
MRPLFAIICAAPLLLVSPVAAAPVTNVPDQISVEINAATNGAPGRPESVRSDAVVDMRIANQVLWDSTQRAIARGVRYRLGKKISENGDIDCSGWVAEITLKAFSAINDAAGREVVFDGADKRILRTGSATIITGIEAATGFALNARQISAETLREGMLIGADFSAPDAEDDTQTHGIDHIVQVVRDPASGKKFISQSSGSGNGVNLMPLEEWLEARALDGLVPAGRVRAVDPFLLANPPARRQPSLISQRVIGHPYEYGLKH